MVDIYQTAMDGEKILRTVQYPATLNAKVDSKTRRAVERMATQNGVSLGEVTRDLLIEGMRAKGIEC